MRFLVLVLLILSLPLPAIADDNKILQLSDAEWMSYVGAEDTEPKEFKISIINPFVGPQEFTQRVKPKGTVSIGGRDYRKAILLHDSGPFADRIMESLTRIADDGFYQRKEEGRERLIAPRPLKVGQTWTSDKETLIFEGIEDFETFNTTIPACLKIKGTSQEVDLKGNATEVVATKYYERGKGLIYKSETSDFRTTMILSQYAGKK